MEGEWREREGERYVAVASDLHAVGEGRAGGDAGHVVLERAHGVGGEKGAVGASAAVDAEGAGEGGGSGEGGEEGGGCEAHGFGLFGLFEGWEWVVLLLMLGGLAGWSSCCWEVEVDVF